MIARSQHVSNLKQKKPVITLSEHARPHCNKLMLLLLKTRLTMKREQANTQSVLTSEYKSKRDSGHRCSGHIAIGHSSNLASVFISEKNEVETFGRERVARIQSSHFNYFYFFYVERLLLMIFVVC